MFRFILIEMYVSRTGSETIKHGSGITFLDHKLIINLRTRIPHCNLSFCYRLLIYPSLSSYQCANKVNHCVLRFVIDY